MSNADNEIIVTKTKSWITNVVVACNFCPFAAREIKRGSIHYEVINNATTKTVLEATLKMFLLLNNNEQIETSILILPDHFSEFNDYLDLVEKVETLLTKNNYEGIYQIASFHPKYMFADSDENDPSNYTNRSPYPMLHFLREESVTKAIAGYTDIENVPKRNIAFTKEKGLAYMQQLLKSI
ncbi:MAG: DUF1415 domain-containing protein [Chitinophagaceae bacterium]|nr:DUF1415 domain-containing protein [Chitinophagaceae bacterium]MBK8605720.1 DUF1415 domain-containing protein [Chitinophagaceae bacterium]MBP6478711.1 DUF1415 domain-containing protein [Chitinophagaceae bacterium]MBP7107539.1 DUF1415 domain-containing protein [Chitinophagaceae bacterium]MBP7315687.1 DUF1415 domain-containing protein [Chitinophagaceae bacterium]